MSNEAHPAWLYAGSTSLAKPQTGQVCPMKWKYS